MFEKVFVINLPHRKDRLESFMNQCPFPEVTVWPAVNGNQCPPPDNWKAGGGAWGCYRSHLNILEHCLNEGISSYLVFEDDAQFKPNCLDDTALFCSFLPEDWEQIYLGGQLVHEYSHPPVKINEHVYRPYNVSRTHAFAVSRRGMIPMYQHICHTPFFGDEHIDHHLGRWHEIPSTKVYAPGKWLVGQMGFMSDISGRKEEVQFYHDPSYLALDHELYHNPVVVVFRGPQSVLRQARHILHQGNQLESHGIDISLFHAPKLKDPTPDIRRWYDWIRSEIVRSNSSALPCLYHPEITIDMVHAANLGRVIEIVAFSVDELKKELSKCV